MSRRLHADSGFTLIEVLIASALVVTAVAALSYLAAAGVMRAHAARRAGAELALAQGKLEELRGALWAYDAAGTPLSDPRLAESAADALSADRGGWSDAFDGFGAPVPIADVRHAVFRRRWSIARFNPADGDTLVIRVCVRAVVSALLSGSERPDACVSSILTRKP